MHMYATCIFLLFRLNYHFSRVMRKPAFCTCENKDADQLRSNCAADQRLCFRYISSTITLLPKSEILSLLLSSVVAQPGQCRTWSETPKTGLLVTRLICPYLNAQNSLSSGLRLSCRLAYVLPRLFPNHTSKPASASMNPRLLLARFSTQHAEQDNRPC